MRNKIHYDKNAGEPGTPACGITGEQTWLSSDPAEVTCKNCLNILAGKSNNRQIGSEHKKVAGWQFPPSLIEQVSLAAKSVGIPAQQLAEQAIRSHLRRLEPKGSGKHIKSLQQVMDEMGVPICQE